MEFKVFYGFLSSRRQDEEEDEEEEEQQQQQQPDVPLTPLPAQVVP